MTWCCGLLGFSFRRWRVLIDRAGILVVPLEHWEHGGYIRASFKFDF